MKLTGNKLQANNNMFIAKKDLSEVYDNYIYLGIYDNQNNYVEVDADTKNNIIKRIKQEREKEIKPVKEIQ